MTRGLLHGPVLSACLLCLAAIPSLAASAPQRVVVAGGALTEIVYALGLEQRLVGVDTTSTYPESASALPNVGYLRSLGAEGVLSLHPDLLLAAGKAGPPTALKQIRAAQVPVERVETPYSREGVAAKIQAVAYALGAVEQGEALIRRYAADWQHTDAALTARSQAPRVLFVLAHGSTLQVAGRATAADAVIRLAGALNAITEFEGYRPLTAESAVMVDPDVVLITTQGLAALGGNDALWKVPGLALTTAGKSRRLVAMEANYLLGFGPRLPQAVLDLSHQMREAAP